MLRIFIILIRKRIQDLNKLVPDSRFRPNFDTNPDTGKTVFSSVSGKSKKIDESATVISHALCVYILYLSLFYKYRYRYPVLI